MFVPASQRVIVALDFDSSAQALQLVGQLGPAAQIYKVGLQLLTAEGPVVVRQLVASGKRVFLDLKLFEIPNSVAAAVAAAGKLGVSMVSVHAGGGSAVLQAAVEAASKFPGLEILALTVITSMTDRDLPELGISATVNEQVLRLASLADAAGCHGIVASAQEAPMLRQALRGELRIVTPGVQLPDASATDQQRTATPAEAIAAGASNVVLGRSITKASNPHAAFLAVCREVNGAFE